MRRAAVSRYSGAGLVMTHHLRADELEIRIVLELDLAFQLGDVAPAGLPVDEGEVEDVEALPVSVPHDRASRIGVRSVGTRGPLADHLLAEAREQAAQVGAASPLAVKDLRKPPSRVAHDAGLLCASGRAANAT